MTKFKVGDRVKAIKSTPLLIKHQVYEVLRISRYGEVIICNSVGEATYNDKFFELVAPTPLTFEADTIFTNKNWEKSHWKVLWADTEGVLIECLDNGGNGCWSIGSRIYWTAYNFNLSFVKYTPPPPEEWRALFYVENGKPEVSANYFPTKEDADNCWNGMNSYMYAIRTDINAKKEN